MYTARKDMIMLKMYDEGFLLFQAEWRQGTGDVAWKDADIDIYRRHLQMYGEEALTLTQTPIHFHWACINNGPQIAKHQT